MPCTTAFGHLLKLCKKAVRSEIYVQFYIMKSITYRMGFGFLFLLSGCLAASVPGYAQRYNRADLASLRSREDSMKGIALQIVAGREAADRFRSDSAFTRMLVRALKTSHSFDYPFDSLATISRVYAPDSSFRVFTWQVIRDESLHRRHGAIQMRTPDGSLKLFPLIDRAHLISTPADTVTNHEWWIGSIYYRIVRKEYQGRPYYTLLGYDEHTMRSTRKRIEVLTFDQDGQPRFGGNYISFREDTLRKAPQARFWIEYKKDGNARMQYDTEMDMIIYDHLISESNEPAKKYTYIPDGDYEGFKWVDGQWVHIEKVFTQKLKDGEAPVIVPLTEDKMGNKAKEAPKKKGKGSN